jgi:phenylalanine dehydrogenase
LEVYQQAELDDVTTVQAANRLCEKRMEDRKKQNSFFTHTTRRTTVDNIFAIGDIVDGS